MRPIQTMPNLPYKATRNSRNHEEDDIVVVRAMNGMTWYIIPLEEGRKHSRYAINHKYQNGPVVVEEKQYPSFHSAMDEVRRRKEQADTEVFRKTLQNNSNR